MKKEEIDQLIEKSLSKEEAAYYHELDEQDLFSMWGNVYKGKMRPWSFLVILFTIAFTGLAFWCGYKFFTIEGTEPLIRFGVGFIVSIVLVQALKIWHWMQMDKNDLLREIKRLEYQVALLMEKMPGK